MKRRILIALFSVGTVFGFGSGIASISFWHGHHAHQRRAAFEAHVMIDRLAAYCWRVDTDHRPLAMDKAGPQGDDQIV